MLSIRRILFPTDLSEPSACAWPSALVLAKQFGAELHLLHVVEPPPRHMEPHAMKYHPENVVRSLTAKAVACMDEQAERADTRGLLVRCEVRVGTDYCEIIRYATAHDIDLIVMATHGRTGIAHALVGSVAEKVVRMAPCPVLTIRRPEFRAQDPMGRGRSALQSTS